MAADRLGVSRYKYRRWESGKVTDGMPTPALRFLQAHEICYLRRRRAGITVYQMAEMIGMSRWWVIQMEHGEAPAKRLIRFWRQRRAG